MKKIYRAELELKTALHIGSGEQSPVGLQKFIRSGSGEIFIPGTTAAGVFITNLKYFIKKSELDEEYKKLMKLIADEGSKESEASILKFRSIFISNPTIKARDRVEIDNTTKTAKSGSLFCYEEIEPEKVNLIMEIELDNISKAKIKENEIVKIDEYIKNVFYQWNMQFEAFGAHSTSGNGWVQLIKASEYTIDNFEKLQKYLDNKIDVIDFAEIDLKNHKNHKTKLKYTIYNITVDLTQKDDYGLDALLIKGGESNTSLKDYDVDAVFINTGKRVFIPGSSIKGAIAAFMEKYGKSEWKNHLGQNEKIKGTIFFTDLFPEKEMLAVPPKDIVLEKIERHQEDEFTRGILNKFNEERVFNTLFKGKILIEEEKIKQIETEFKFLRDSLQYNLISIGANGCFPKIEIEEDKNEN